MKPLAYALLLGLGIFLGNRIGNSYSDKYMSAELEKTEFDPYIEVFNGIPEGSIGDIYNNFYKDL